MVLVPTLAASTAVFIIKKQETLGTDRHCYWFLCALLATILYWISDTEAPADWWLLKSCCNDCLFNLCLSFYARTTSSS